MPAPKVAIVCDWLVGTGGAERVVYELHKMFPQAPIYTSQYDKSPKAWYGADWFSDADVRTGWLQSLPLGLRKFLPVLRAWYFSRLDLSAYDLVISSSGAEAKAVRVKGGAVHINYCHAPTHYYWSRYDEYLANPGFGWLDPIARLGLKLLAAPMRRWDKKAAQRPTHIIANSHYTKGQIKKYYDRGSVVVHPPVDIDRFKLLNKLSNSRSGFVVAGRQTPYKRHDLAVVACSKLSLPLNVIGNGPAHTNLEKLAGPSIKFITDASDEDVVKLFQSAEGFIFPGVDDFGIVAVEALAAGTPVIAYGKGGALDFVSSENGVLFKEQSVSSLCEALKNFDATKYNHALVADTAKQFSPQEFQNKMRRFIDKIGVANES